MLLTHTHICVFTYIYIYVHIVIKKRPKQFNSLNLGNGEGFSQLAAGFTEQLVGNPPCVQLAHIQYVLLIFFFLQHTCDTQNCFTG